MDTIGDGTADNREPVEDYRRLIGVLEQQLAQDVEHDCEDQKGSEP